MAARNQHVVPHEGKWAVRGEGSNRVRVFDTKQEAIDSALEIARRSGTEALIHGRQGQIFRRAEGPSRLSEKTLRKVVRDLAGKQSASRKKKSLPGLQT